MVEVIGVLVDLGGTRPGIGAREVRDPQEERPTMKLITWVVLGAAAFVALALFAGEDDIRRFRRMYRM
jgi:hypothetical protein